ncbi:MAG: YjbQ family protein [Syntrophales bacterium]
MDFKIINSYLSISTGGDTDIIIDITPHVSKKVTESRLTEGQVLLFVPEGNFYRHDARWGDGNGYAHVRAALPGPSLTVPLTKGSLVLGA